MISWVFYAFVNRGRLIAGVFGVAASCGIARLFYVVSRFYGRFSTRGTKGLLRSGDKIGHEQHTTSLSSDRVVAVLLCFRFNAFHGFGRCCLFFVGNAVGSCFPGTISCGHFIRLRDHIFFRLVFFLGLKTFKEYANVAFVSSAVVPMYRGLEECTGGMFGKVTASKGKAVN